MTDDRSLERAARSWLEDGPTRAPDRVVEGALLRIRSTPQERGFRVPWRLPSMNLTARIALLAVVGALALAGMAAFGGPGGRSIAPAVPPAQEPSAPAVASLAPSPSSSAGPSSSPDPQPRPQALSMDEYRVARDAICTRGTDAKAPLTKSFGLAIDPAASDAQRAEGIKALESFVVLSTTFADELEALTPPLSIAADHIANVQQYRDITTLIRYELTLLHRGKISDAAAVDLSTDQISGQIVAFENINGFRYCP